MVSRNAASNMQVTMETTGLKTDGVVCSPSKPRKKPKQGAGVTLIPITPLHEIPGGSLYVDGQQQRVVYLASLTSTAAEKYFARTNKSTQESEASDEEGEEDVDGSGGVRQRRTKEKPQVQLTSPLRKLLVKLERREKRPVVKDEKKHVSIFDQSHTLDDNNNQGRQEFNTRKPRARGQKQEEDDMVKLKQRIRLMPLTDDDQAEFWALMKQYQKLQMEYRKSVRQDQTSPMTFNVGAAWDKKIREEQHHWWVRAHDERILATLQRKAVEDEKFEQRILESTSEHRAKMRLLRQVREKLMFDAQNVMPTILLCAATHKMFVNLLANWKQRRLEVRLREIVHFWRQERTTRNSNVQAVRVLINWLQKSVAVKSVAFRVFRGIRTYVRRVKQLQRLWKVKIAKRMRNFLIVEKMWTELETAMVDKATEDYEQRLARVEQQAARKKKRAGTKAGSRDNLDKWMTFVTEDLRCEVIREFIRDKENEFSQRFRQQEEELFPHLVQTLRGQNPNRARSYIKAMALGYILLGRVHSVLQNYPGAVDDIPTIQPFDMHEAPIEELIRKARSRSPPDTTGQRFVAGTRTMQNDEAPSNQLIARQDDEERKKQLLQFLEKRKQYREKAPTHPANEPLLRISPQSVKQVSAPGHDLTLKIGDIVGDGNSEKADTAVVPSKDSPNHFVSQRRGHATTGDAMNSGVVAFGLVVVCCSFRYLPSLSDKTKEIASQLFDALVDSHFARFSRRGSKLLINPSVIEFQDTMKELKSLCFTEGQESTFFMCLSSHGARVTSGTNEGSYVLFSETRLSSEEELLLTAIHEQELARLVHEIPCRNKFLALELCQTKEATEKPAKEDEKIRNRIHDEFASRFYAQLAKLELSTRGEGYDRSIDVEPRRSHTVILESCDVKTESPLRHSDDQVSNFLHRLNFAFHGGAACLSLDDELIERPHLRLKEVIKYVKEMIMMDAALQNELVKTEYKKQVRTKFELIAEFQEVTHTPQLVGDADGVDFAIGDVPAAPTEHPAQPRLEGSTLNSITISWDAIKGFPPSTSQEIPTILGYHIQYQGDGRTCESWKRAAAFQVLTFENAVHLRKKPPTKVTVFGIPSELAFRFRVRARTAGGWGPFSPVSPAFRTQSVASHHDQFTTVQAASEAKGVEGILALMSRHVANRDIQRVCVEFLGRMALKVKSPQQSRRLIPGLDQPAVTLTIRSMDRFRHDTPLIQQGCLFLGRLAMSDDAWRRALLKMENPRCLEFLQDIHNRFAKTDSTTASSTRWAMERLRGTSARRRFSPEEAARRIQGLYRMRKARQYVQSLAESIYTQMIDPESGMAVFYNTRTGTTAWSLPSFLQV